MNLAFSVPYCLVMLVSVQTEGKQAVKGRLTYVDAAREEVRIFKTTAEILATVSDKEAADAAIENLRVLRKDAQAYWRDSQNLQETTEEIDETLRKDADSALARFRSEVSRIKYVQGGAGVRQEIQAIFLAFTRGCDSAEKLTWRWSDEKADLAYSIKTHLHDCNLEVVQEKEYGPIKIRGKSDGKVIYSTERFSSYFVCTRWKQTIYIAAHSSIATGCTVIALDLNTGKELWKTRLCGTGPTPFMHSKYSNAINIETDGKRVIIFGKEDDGRYAECLDIVTGATLANQRFDIDPEPRPKE
jgi:hypothetical protein